MYILAHELPWRVEPSPGIPEFGRLLWAQLGTSLVLVIAGNSLLLGKLGQIKVSLDILVKSISKQRAGLVQLSGICDNFGFAPLYHAHPHPIPSTRGLKSSAFELYTPVTAH